MSITKNFSVEDVQIFGNQDNNVDFAIAEIWAFAEGNNSHSNPISKEVLERDADTFKGKFVVAKFNKFKNDVTTHVSDEAIVGYVNPQEKIEFKTKIVDGIEKEFVVVKCLLSKIYANEIVEMFKFNNERTVSCEFACNLQYEENEKGHAVDEYGIELNIPNPILSYHIYGITILGLSFTPSIRGTEIKIKQFAEKNKNLNLNELAKQKFIEINKEFSSENLLDKDNEKEANMSLQEDKIKFSESEKDEKEKDIVMEEQPKETEENFAEDKETEEEKESEENKEAEKEMGCDEKEMSEPKESEEDKEFEEDKQDEEDEKDEPKEKEFSLDAYVDEGAMLQMLENETEDNIQLVNSVAKEFSAIEILQKVVQLSKENMALKTEKEEYDREKKEKLFSAIMASVKEDLTEGTYNALLEEGKEITLDQIGSFENKVKAFAYEESMQIGSKQKEADVMIYGASEQGNTDNLDVFERISKM